MTNLVGAFTLLLVVLGLVSMQYQHADQMLPTQGPATEPSLDTAGPSVDAGDTHLFVYEKPNAATPYYDGFQPNGTMHKVGLCSEVNSSFPQITAAASQLIASAENAARDAYLISSGYTPQLAVRYWLVDVVEATEVDSGAIELSVECHAGSDACGGCVDGVLEEQWRLSNGQLTLSSRQFVDGFRALGNFSLEGNY